MRRQRGISLVELLVSVTILALATTVALVVYDQARLAYKAGENTTEQQQVARVAFDVITSDVRMAGFNTNPDGNPARPDEQIEAAYATAITVRADFDADDPVDVDLPEQSLGGVGAAFRAVSTGNDEIVSYVLAKPDGSSADTLAFSADVGDAVRDASIEDVAIGNVDLTQADPPYTLYKVVLENDPTGCCGTSFARRIPIVDNVRSLRFRYWDRAGAEIAPPGGDETPAAVASRSAIRRVGVEIEALTRDSDPHWRDAADTDPDTQLFRKFELSGDVMPPNLGRAAIPDLQADATPPGAPSTPFLYPGHCEGLYVDWPANPPQDDVAYYRVAYGTDPASLDTVRSSVTPGLYLGDLADAVDYHVAVQAVDAAGNLSSNSSIVQETTVNTNTPATAVTLVAADGQGQVDLSWEATTENTGATVGDPASPMIRDLAGYRVYRGTSPGIVPSFGSRIADETSVANLPAPVFADDTVPSCKTHYYKVAAVDGCGVEGQPSNEVSGRSMTTIDPEAPLGVQAYVSGSSQVTVDWPAVQLDVAGNPVYIDTYKIYRSPLVSSATTAPPSWSFLNQVSGATRYVDPIVIPAGETVFYLVQAVDECVPANESLLSAPARPSCSFSGTVAILDPPANAFFRGLQNVQVTVSGAAPGATHDQVELIFTADRTGLEQTIVVPGPGPTWNYAWDAQPSGSPSFDSGPYLVRARVRQWNGAEACFKSGYVRVTIHD